MRRMSQHAQQHTLIRKFGWYTGCAAIVGVIVALPTAAFAAPPIVTHTKTTYTVNCEYTTPLDLSTPIPVTETINTTKIQDSSSLISTVVGVVTVTAPNGRTLRFVDHYTDTPIGNPPEVQEISGRAVVGPGAFGGDITYLEGGSAYIDHYGIQHLISGPSLSVCTALGA